MKNYSSELAREFIDNCPDFDKDLVINDIDHKHKGIVSSAYSQSERADATFMDDVIDGCGFEILSLKSLEESHLNGDERHRSELCTLYIRENYKCYHITRASPPNNLVRRDLRLTVDYPEDLLLCRAVYEKLKHQAPKFNLNDIVNYLDSKPALKALVAPYAESGYSTIYL